MFSPWMLHAAFSVDRSMFIIVSTAAVAAIWQSTTPSNDRSIGSIELTSGIKLISRSTFIRVSSKVEPGDDVVPAAGRVQCRQVHAAGVGFGFHAFDLEAAVAGDQFGCQRVQAQIRIDAVVRAQVDLRIDIRRDHDQRTRCGGVVHAALFGDHLLQLFAVLGFGDRSR